MAVALAQFKLPPFRSGFEVRPVAWYDGASGRGNGLSIWSAPLTLSALFGQGLPGSRTVLGPILWWGAQAPFRLAA